MPRHAGKVRGSSRVIVFDGSTFNDFLGDKLEDRLEEVDIEVKVIIDALEEIILSFCIEAVIADEMAYHRPIFLFDMRLVVLVVRS